MRTIDIGDTVWLKASFENENGDPADPTTVTFRLLTPAGDESTVYTDADPEIENPATGEYRYEFTAPNAAGVYTYRYVGTGAIKQAGEEDIRVRESKFATPV